MKPSERIQGLHRKLLEEISNVDNHEWNRLILDAIIRYLDEEYENKQYSRKPLEFGTDIGEKIQVGEQKRHD